MLRGKRIVIGVTGSIAAYKSAILIRLLVKGGAQVKVVILLTKNIAKLVLLLFITDKKL